MPIDPDQGVYELRATEEVSVTPRMTPEDFERRAEAGEFSRGDAVIFGAGANVGALRGKPDYEKSRFRNLVEEFTGSVLEEVTRPAAKTLEGMVNEDAGKFFGGLGEQALAGAVPVVVREGASALVSKVPVLGRDVVELGTKALERAKPIFEAATEKLPFEYSANYPVRTSGTSSWKGTSPKSTGGMGPVLKGRAGEALSEAEAVAAGESVRGKHVTFELPSGKRTVSDLLTESASGLKVREAKMGPKARLTLRQMEMQSSSAAGESVVPRGANAEKAGLTPGKPVKVGKFKETGTERCRRASPSIS